MKMLKTLVLVGILAGMGMGCATTKQVVPLPDQSKLIADATKARIYVMRLSYIGADCSATIWDGPQKMGSMAAKGYLCWERDPGDTVIRVFQPVTKQATLPIKCEKGQTYYIRHAVNIGTPSQCTLDLMPQSEGAAQLLKCKPPRVL